MRRRHKRKHVAYKEPLFNVDRLRKLNHALFALAVVLILYVLVQACMLLVPAITKDGEKNSSKAQKNTLVEYFLSNFSPVYLYAKEKQETEETFSNETTKIEGAEDSAGTLNITISGDLGSLFLKNTEKEEEEASEKEEEKDTNKEDTKQTLSNNSKEINTLKKNLNQEYLLKHFFIVDSSTTVTEEMFPVKTLLNMDMSVTKDNTKPQILIHHSHASETFVDSRNGVQEDTVVGMGIELARILSEKYGYQVIHDKTAYDMMTGELDRNKAYNYAKDGTLRILEEYPSIEVIIDLHRDGGNKRVTTINGKPTAQIMLFNGLSRNTKGPIDYLYNPYIKENLAFSLQLKIASMEKYADFTKKIYLKGYLYNLDLRPKSLLIEVGTNKNTVEEAINAMMPLAEILNEVLENRDTP